MTKQEAVYNQALSAAANGWTFTRSAERNSAIAGIDPFTTMAVAGNPVAVVSTAKAWQARHIGHGLSVLVDTDMKKVIAVRAA